MTVRAVHRSRPRRSKRPRATSSPCRTTWPSKWRMSCALGWGTRSRSVRAGGAPGVSRRGRPTRGACAPAVRRKRPSGRETWTASWRLSGTRTHSSWRQRTSTPNGSIRFSCGLASPFAGENSRRTSPMRPVRRWSSPSSGPIKSWRVTRGRRAPIRFAERAST